MKNQNPRLKIIFTTLALSLITLLFNFSILFGQEGSWEFGKGNKMLIDQSSNPLEVRVKGKSSLSSYSFVGAVGGIAFQEVAINTFNYKNITVNYNPQNEDGYRLEITINENSFTPFIPDWQLIPIIKYADSYYNSCISLFGENTTQIKYGITYHRAFENTLMGIRLLHADILLMNMGNFREMPKFNGKVILGKGEQLPDKNSWKEAAIKLQDILQEYSYQSWIITDVDEEITIKKTMDEIQFAGIPYYYFWKTNFEEYKKEFKRLEELANKYKKIGDIETHNFYVNQANNLEPKVYPVSSLTEKVKEKTYLIKEINPAAYNALVNTMKYAAFFRYIKENDPQRWNKLLSDTKFVSINPKVKTPTTWYK